jgi:hypothetical protein
MKSKQLANVLIKMLGLSICVYGIPSIVLGLVEIIGDSEGVNKGITILEIIATLAASGAQVLIGIFIMKASKKIAGWMFTNEEE